MLLGSGKCLALSISLEIEKEIHCSRRLNHETVPYAFNLSYPGKNIFAVLYFDLKSHFFQTEF